MKLVRARSNGRIGDIVQAYDRYVAPGAPGTVGHHEWKSPSARNNA